VTLEQQMDYLLDLLDNPILDASDPTGEKRTLAIKVCEANPRMLEPIIATTEKRLEKAEKFARDR
jgi:hypothetical protein